MSSELTDFSGSTYFCWAFSCSSMLRASCSILTKQLLEAGKIDQQRKSTCLNYISEDGIHEIIRNLITMILLPKKLHKNDICQAAYLRAAVSRVSRYIFFEKYRLRFRLPTQPYLKKRVSLCCRRSIVFFLLNIISH